MTLWATNTLMRAVNMLREGMTIKEVAAALGKSEREVKEHLTEMRKLGMAKL